MSQYGVALDGWWEGKTGREVAARGGKDAQILAWYLFKNPDDNMIGLYRTRLVVIRERINTLTMPELLQAFAVLSVCKFADYDTVSEYVWVRELAHYRLQLYKGAPNAGDNRVKGAQALYFKAQDNPFLESFFRRYRTDLHLLKARRYRGACSIIGRGLEGASKPVTGNSNTKQEQVKSVTEDQDQRADARQASVADSLKVLTRLAHDVLDGDSTLSDSDLADELKILAARNRIVYDGRVITKALESARTQRERRKATA